MTQTGLITGPDGLKRCFWPGDKADYLAYHDDEWGQPVDDDIKLFEKICLEGFQAGLSWLTILRKRENFRAGFDQFDYIKIAKYKESKVNKLLQDKGIIRHRGKIESTINNANRAIELSEEFGSLGAYFWQWEPPKSERPAKITEKALANELSKTDTSTALSKDLKKRGWSFVGPTTVYSFMQAMGIVNDHLEGCYCRAEITKARKRFKRPS